MTEEKRWISSEALFTVIKELLAEHRQAVFTVTGMSMWPYLCHGRDQVVVEQCNPKDLKKGDVILFQLSFKQYRLHRITWLGSDSFETTGDGNCFRDGIFPASCLIARVVKIVRKGKPLDCQLWYLRLYARLWMALFPFRRTLFRLWSRLRPLFRH